MNCGLFFCFLLGHFISDFILQSDSIVERRYSKDKKVRREANIAHVVRYFTVTFILTLYYISIWTVLSVAVLSAVHFLADSWKTGYGAREPISRYRMKPFFLDQFVHFISILAASIFISFTLPKTTVMAAVARYIVKFVNSSAAGVTYTDRVILSALLFVLGVWGMGCFIHLFFDKRKYKNIDSNLLKKMEQANEKDSQKLGTEAGGFIIGILERIFIICAIVVGINEVIGFVLATKSIARLKKFDDDKFVEDFIIGSFISFISAIVIGVIIKALKVYFVIGS